MAQSINTVTKKIFFHKEGVNFNLKNKAVIRTWIGERILYANYEANEINFIFVSDEYLYKINLEQLQHDYYTDIITFPYHEPESKKIFADIYISIDRVKDNAILHNVPFDTELHRVMIHGILHLLGYDDHNVNDIQKMREEEEKALENLQTLI